MTVTFVALPENASVSVIWVSELSTNHQQDKMPQKSRLLFSYKIKIVLIVRHWELFLVVMTQNNKHVHKTRSVCKLYMLVSCLQTYAGIEQSRDALQAVNS